VTGSAFVESSRLRQVLQLYHEASVIGFVRDLAGFPGLSNNKTIRRFQTADKIAETIKHYADQHRQRGQDGHTESPTDVGQKLLDKVIDRGAEWAKGKSAEWIDEKTRQAFTSGETQVLRWAGVPDAEAGAVAEKLNRLAGNILAAFEIYVHLLEVAAAVAFVDQQGRLQGSGRIWFDKHPPSSHDKTFLMAVFVGIGAQGVMRTSLEATPSTPASSPAAKPPDAVFPTPLLSARLGSGVAARTLPSPPRQVSTETRVVAVPDLYGHAWFYWKTP
jgi:hypothetical protein